MWEFIADIIYPIILTLFGIIALDYLFGTDKLKDFREEFTSKYQFEFVVCCWIVIVGLLHAVGHAMDSKIIKDLTTFYISCSWLVIWIYHTFINVRTGILTFRNNNLLKRKKPH